MKTLATGLFFGCCLVASASTITFDTPSGATTSGGPVDASATFDITSGSISITLTDLQANPTDVAQLLSDISFTLNNATTGTLTSSAGQEITVNGDGTFVLGPTVSTGWALGTSGGIFTLDVLGTPTGPSHLIIGPPGPGGTYSNANGSIAGNKPHNPFLNQTATFDLSVPGANVDTTVTGVTFSFGTTAGIDVTGIPGTTIPEQPTYLLFGSALLAFVSFAKKFRPSRG